MRVPQGKIALLDLAKPKKAPMNKLGRQISPHRRTGQNRCIMDEEDIPEHRNRENYQPADSKQKRSILFDDGLHINTWCSDERRLLYNKGE
jgi:hypothetical protein